jgi:hypothetical protein
MMVDQQQIKLFVKNILGCQCPQEVFQHIEQKTLADGLKKLIIGQRLLIYLVLNQEAILAPEKLENLLQAGVKERNRNHYNRFRLVIFLPLNQSNEDQYYAAFRQSDYYDDKTHLHLLDKASGEQWNF